MDISLGKPFWIDATTLNLQRARFARMCVEVHLRKPLKRSVLINGGRYFVSYEGLTNICAKCGIYGHSVHKCPQGESSPSGNALVHNAVGDGQEMDLNNDGFTPARQPHRRSTPIPKPIVFQAGGYGENLRRNLRKISGLRRISRYLTVLGSWMEN